MKKYIPLYIISMFFLLLTACEDEAGDLKLPTYEPKLVIDGQIEQGKYAQVTLTKSASYFADIDSAALREALVSTAKVSISDGEKSEVLTLTKNSDKFPPYYYKGTELVGEVGKTYTLTVETQGQVYQAETSIPEPPKFDNLSFEFDSSEDTLALLGAEFTDNAEEENYYRIFTYRENKDVKYVPMYLSTLGDKYFNGETFSLNILRGSQSLTEIADDIYFTKGDTIRVKFCSLDKAHFDFWRTLEREAYSVGNPFTSSGNEILSNTGEGTLGVWGGYGATYYQLIVK
ncbi:DUF4249 domain-containing protein [Chondrinema litorale]|uniref:DUF4249 domain-containing protein n=1 Tax=Chondrinema litorale TaxID=2994555 RepID=UPI002543AFDF|nr:DUF4249 domain-containing protein [Chondrinema litorale]UZR97061.1 DUF4249 domain-containing protein [Chondrinema litorale]